MYSIFGAMMTDLVDITLEDDVTQERQLRSKLKTYVIDPTNALGPPTLPIVPFNTARYKTRIVTNDASVVVTMDNPTNASITTAAATPPPGDSIVLTSQGDGVEIYGPDPVWIVSITGNAATRVDVIRTIWEDA